MNKMIIGAALTLMAIGANATEVCDRLEKYKAIKSNSTEAELNGQDRFGVVDGNTTTQIRTADQAIAFLSPLCAKSKKPDPKFGMTTKQVRENTNWGEPDSINRSGNARRTYEQWVYGNSYLYFVDGKLTAYN